MTQAESDNPTKTALVIGPGGLRGAYNAGVAVTLGRELGRDEIDSIYASSVGVYMAAFFAAGQYHPIEHVWRNLVHGDQLVDITKIFAGRSWLDLEYLAAVLQRDDKNSRLDVAGVIESDIDVTYTLTDKKTGNPVYKTPTEDNIFDLMTASCAVPFMHHSVNIQGREFIDGGISDPLPIKKALDDGNDKLIVIDDKLKGGGSHGNIMKALSWLFNPPIAKRLRSYREHLKDCYKTIENDSRIIAVRPDEPLPMRYFMDTSEKRINETFDRGIVDAEKFLHNTHL
jgi:predicted patatin/cPLA2 family phospholipase